MDMYSARLPYGGLRVSARDLGEMEHDRGLFGYILCNDMLNYETLVLSENLHSFHQASHGTGMSFPKTNGENRFNTQVIARNSSGEIINYAVFPIESYNYNDGKVDLRGDKLDPFYSWRFSVPERDYAFQIACERQEYEESLNR